MNLLKELAECYGKLYDKVAVECRNDALARFFAVEGKHYRDSPKVRFMVVGRCVNGWFPFKENSRAEFVKEAENCISKTGFNFWLTERGSSNGQDGKNRYSINQPAFWNVSKSALMSQNEDAKDKKDWFEYLVWCNLYTFSPVERGNTTENQKKAQPDELCQELLRKEIEYYEPTHILFSTGWDEWFEHVAPIFGESLVNRHIHNVGIKHPSDLTCVEAAGIWNNKKIVVAIRPERWFMQKYEGVKEGENRKTAWEKFTTEIKEAFASLK